MCVNMSTVFNIILHNGCIKGVSGSGRSYNASLINFNHIKYVPVISPDTILLS